jgi:V/A-type H+-transporting ATPase subunit K
LKRWIAISFVAVVILVGAVMITSAARAQIDQGRQATAAESGNLKWAFLAAAISTAFGCLGAGIAVAYVGAAAVGAVGEKPEVAGRTLIFVGLAEGIAIYGLIISIMILGKV